MMDDDELNLNHCCESLRFVKMRSTGVRVPGIKILFNYAKNLEGVRCNSYDVLHALVSHLKFLRKLESLSTYEDKSIYRLSLKYLDFSNCFGILYKFLYLLPDLIEVRIGADAPPKIRQASQRLRTDDIIVDNNLVDDKKAASDAALYELPLLNKLQ